MKKVNMNNFDICLINENIITENIYGCIVILMQTKKHNIIFHIRADNLELKHKAISFYNENEIKKAIQFLPAKVGKMKLKPLNLKSKIIRYSPKVLLNNCETVSFAQLLNIPINEINTNKSKNYVGIINKKFVFNNFKIVP